MSRRLVPAGLLAGLAAVALAACGGASDSKDSTGSAGSGGGSGKKDSISLVAYSTPQVVYDEIVPDFQKTSAGQGVDVRSSFGASGDQSRAVEAGLKADTVSFSVEPDVTRLVKAGLVAGDWKTQTPYDGLVTTSLVAFIVRPGNPKHIKTWDDLVKPGVEVLTPNPFTSGAAKWNLLGAYAHGGLPYLTTLLQDHVKVQDKSGREALQTFVGGKGDVLLSYEYEATTAQKKGEKVDYVLPPDTVKIDIDIANLKTAKPAAKSFLDYVLSEPAQQHFADWGYRPVNPTVLKANASKFPTPETVKTIDQLGGWKTVNDKLFDPDKGSVAKIETDLGVPTSK